MRLTERVLILMLLIGYWLAVWRSPADLSLFLICGLALAAWYLLMMPLLLGKLTLRELFRGGRIDRAILIWGLMLGLVYAYGTLSFVFHSLGWMGSRDLVENCGLLLLLFALPVIWLYGRTRKPRYRMILLRLLVLALVLGLSLLVHPWLPANPGLQRMNPL